MPSITYSQCPVCNSSIITKSLQAKDYTVSHETFEIWYCADCTFRFTQHIPDAENVGPYYQSAAYVSHSDTQEGFINKLYHIIRNYTLQTKRKLIQQQTHLQQGNLLDVGAGTGAFTNAMQQHGWNFIGLEPDGVARKNAFDKYSLQLQPPENLYQQKEQYFDAITMWHVLEHVHDLHRYMETFHRILKPSGVLVIAVPNFTSYDAQLYQQYWAAYDVPRHLYHFSPQSMQTLAELKGFTVEAFKPMWFDSFYVSMLSEQYKNGKSNLIKAAWNGLLSNIKAIGNAKRCSSVIYVLKKK